MKHARGTVLLVALGLTAFGASEFGRADDASRGGLPPVLYVRADAPPGGDGTSWATAFNDLVDALCAAAGSGGDVLEIWVAAGAYTPDAGSGDRSASFVLVDGVSVYGGFTGDETQLDQRDPAANVTILGGEIGAPGDETDNCYHVLDISNNDTTAVLDGFTITGGYADGDEPDDGGAGVLAWNGGDATLIDCVITHNTATDAGAGVRCAFGGGVTLERCMLTNNTVTQFGWPNGGGGVHCYGGSSPILRDCVIRDNSGMFGAGVCAVFNCEPELTRCTLASNTCVAEGEGGALYLYGVCSPDIDRCVFENNSANYGGGINAVLDCVPELDACIFRNNTSDVDGGGIYLYDNCSAPISNTLFTGNQGGFGGAIITAFDSNAEIINSTFVGNTATLGGGGIYNYFSSPILANTLMWDNTTDGIPMEEGQIAGFESTPTISYCSIQSWTGLLGGVGNDGDDPLFVDADGADDVYGTPDDDARLQPTSPARDAGDNAAVPVGVTLDLAGGPRIVAGTVDRGAYEFHYVGDIDADGDVDFDDLNLLLAAYGSTTGEAGFNPTADLDADGDVDFDDLNLLLAGYGV